MIRNTVRSLLKKNFLQKCLLIVLIAILMIYITHPGRFTKRYTHVPDEDIKNYLTVSREVDINSCPLFPELGYKVIDVDFVAEYNQSEWASLHRVNQGGWWSPDRCEPVHHIAIIVPYRDRVSQLITFLHYMHVFLQNQHLHYRIIVVEQSAAKAFNRGKLMNVGYKEALKLQAFPCFIFHDVDLIPQVGKNIYACTLLPRHMSASVNVLRYNLLYHGLFGGAIAMTSEQFHRVNGFSNLYFGWGAEDDDILMRIRSSGMDILRFSPEISRYFMLSHKAQVKNPDRFSMLNLAEGRIRTDGLNTLEYDVLAYRTESLYTHIIVDI